MKHRVVQLTVHAADEGVDIHLVAQPNLIQIGLPHNDPGKAVRAFVVVEIAVVHIHDERADVVICVERGEVIALAAVFSVHDDHGFALVFGVFHIRFCLRACRVDGTARCGKRGSGLFLLGSKLSAFLVGHALALNRQADLEGWKIGCAGAGGGRLPIDRGGEGVRRHDRVAFKHFVVGAIALRRVEGELDRDEIGGAGAEEKIVLGLHIVARPLSVHNGGTGSHQIDVAALDGADGDFGLHFAGVARLRHVKDDVDMIELGGFGGGCRQRHKGEGKCRDKQEG